MSIGFWEIVILIGVLLIIILASRYKTKRICPRCGFTIRTYARSCPDCGMVFPRKPIQKREERSEKR